MHALEEYKALPYTERIFLNVLTYLSLFTTSELQDVTVYNNRKFEFYFYNTFNKKTFINHYYFSRPSEIMTKELIRMIKKEFPNVPIKWEGEE